MRAPGPPTTTRMSLGVVAVPVGAGAEVEDPGAAVVDEAGGVPVAAALKAAIWSPGFTAKTIPPAEQ